MPGLVLPDYTSQARVLIRATTAGLSAASALRGAFERRDTAAARAAFDTVNHTTQQWEAEFDDTTDDESRTQYFQWLRGRDLAPLQRDYAALRQRGAVEEVISSRFDRLIWIWRNHTQAPARWSSASGSSRSNSSGQRSRRGSFGPFWLPINRSPE